MNREIFRALAIGSLAFTAGCVSIRASEANEAPEVVPSPSITDTPPPTNEYTLTSTPVPDTDGYFSEGLVCPAEPRQLDLPEVGDVIEFQNMSWKIVTVSEGEGETCPGGIRIVIEFCPCEEETQTPTATLTATKTATPRPGRTPTPTESREDTPKPTTTERPPTKTPESPTDTPEPPPPTPPIPTPIPTNEDIIPTATQGS